MPLTLNNMTLAQAKLATSYESTPLKIAKFSGAVICLITAIVVCSYNFERMSNSNKIQDNCEELTAYYSVNQTYCSNSTVYDWAFLDGPFTDEIASDHLQYLLKQCDSECLTIGTQWSILFVLNAYTMLIMAVLSFAQALGVWVFHSRVVSTYVQIPFCILNFCVVVTTACYRFSSIGKLAALSLAPSELGSTDGQTTLVDTRTYVDDGQLIFRLFVVNLIFVIVQCCLGCFSVAVPTQDKLRKMNVTFLDGEMTTSNSQISVSAM